ncbi:hypothetical protein BD626DRAFT_582647 [Schizophyllum amplum]|uniref:Helicase ATP-binding domain-containing protein n=1 Tax=Schizophyllum amplum TaxID=97359 RepID=A0A550CJ32_9AGAR|nr:hypothetical protein BD626DRAFT_582647 [Auriculariopsis ampla]
MSVPRGLLSSWLHTRTMQEKLDFALVHIDRALFPLAYILRLPSRQRISEALDLCITCWLRTRERQCPKAEQLETAFSLLSGNDTFLYAGTGSGKTLSAILHAYLEKNHGITLMIAPMKRIQASHSIDFWKTFTQSRVHDIGKKKPGNVEIIVATPEQLFRSVDGHYSRFGNLMRGSIESTV